VFDLDPGWASNLVACCRLALRIRALLGDLGLSCHAKTSGWNGLHVFAPVAEATYRVTKALARAVARCSLRRCPSMRSTSLRWTSGPDGCSSTGARTTSASSPSPPYSLRARPHPTVSMPLRWQEVEDAVSQNDASGLWFGPEDATERVKRFGDLFRPVLGPGAEVPDGAAQALLGSLRR
jgi:bifunctional non-homologous end joining protein LigD